MNLLVALGVHFVRTPDGKIWGQTMSTYTFWTRYLEVFDRVRVLARVKEVSSLSGDWHRADGDGVTFISVPDYRGLTQYLLRSRQIKQSLKGVVGPEEAVILRLPSWIGTLLANQLVRSGHPYAVEVIGDPYDGYSPGANRHPLRPFFRWWFTRTLQWQCRGACAATYVTQGALQWRYPAGPGAYSTYFSDVELRYDYFVAAPRRIDGSGKPLTLIMVGSLGHFYKAPDILILAVHACVQEGLDLRLVLVGDGKERKGLESRVAELGLAERVLFAGQLPAGDAVRARLDQADLFVLPSRQEGLPRAMIEAMARALPCLGSTVGGIPELLSPEDLVPPNDAAALAQKIREVLTDPCRLERMSARNLKRSKDYQEELLRQRRIPFYQVTMEKTEKWLKIKGPV